MRAVVTVVGADKIGIVAGVTATLSELEANIIEISQTLMSGAFTMMMVVETRNSDFSAFQAELSRKGEAPHGILCEWQRPEGGARPDREV